MSTTLADDLIAGLYAGDEEARRRVAAWRASEPASVYAQRVALAKEQNQHIFGNEADEIRVTQVDLALATDRPDLTPAERLAAAIAITELGGFKPEGEDADRVEAIAEIKQARLRVARGQD
jgi:hypothetical protein